LRLKTRKSWRNMVATKAYDKHLNRRGNSP
jgi:hypothetical protein